jgi:hypothetical protein
MNDPSLPDIPAEIVVDPPTQGCPLSVEERSLKGYFQSSSHTREPFSVQFLESQQLESYGNKNQSACRFHLSTKSRRKPIPQSHGSPRHGAGDNADDRRRKKQALPEDSKTEAYSQGVHAGGKGKPDKTEPPGGVRAFQGLFVFFRAEAFVTHFASDKSEESEGNPGGPIASKSHQVLTNETTDERHQKLKQSEVEGESKNLARQAKARSYTQTDGKGITTERHCYEEGFDRLQSLSHTMAAR